VYSHSQVHRCTWLMLLSSFCRIMQFSSFYVFFLALFSTYVHIIVVVFVVLGLFGLFLVSPKSLFVVSCVLIISQT
jgi:hypothetical protein